MRYVLAFLAALVLWIVVTACGVVLALVLGISADDYQGGDMADRMRVAGYMGAVIAVTTTIFAATSIGIAIAAAGSGGTRRLHEFPERGQTGYFGPVPKTSKWGEVESR